MISFQYSAAHNLFIDYSVLWLLWITGIQYAIVLCKLPSIVFCLGIYYFIISGYNCYKSYCTDSLERLHSDLPKSSSFNEFKII